MSWQASDYVRQLRGVTAIEKAVLYSLADRHNTTDGGCWPRVALIAEESGLSVRRTHDNLKRLVDKGLIRIEERQREDGSTASNFYAFVELEPDDKSGATRRRGAGRSVMGGLTKRQTLEPIREPNNNKSQTADQMINYSRTFNKLAYAQLLEQFGLQSGIYSERYWDKDPAVPEIQVISDLHYAIDLLTKIGGKGQRCPTPSWLSVLEDVGRALRETSIGPAFHAMRRLRLEDRVPSTQSAIETACYFKDEFLELLDQETRGYTE